MPSSAYEEMHSATNARYHFQTSFEKQLPAGVPLVTWVALIIHKQRNLGQGRPSASDNNVKMVHKKSTHRAGQKLGMPKSRVRKYREMAYGKDMQDSTVKSSVTYQQRKYDFYKQMLNCIDEDDDFLRKHVFSDEATFMYMG